MEKSNLFTPEFIPYYLDVMKEYKLSSRETLVYWEIRKHWTIMKKDIISSSWWSLDNIITKLSKKIEYSQLNVHLIKEHRFFLGKGSTFRLELEDFGGCIGSQIYIVICKYNK